MEKETGISLMEKEIGISLMEKEKGRPFLEKEIGQNPLGKRGWHLPPPAGEEGSHRQNLLPWVGPKEWIPINQTPGWLMGGTMGAS